MPQTLVSASGIVIPYAGATKKKQSTHFAENPERLYRKCDFDDDRFENREQRHDGMDMLRNKKGKVRDNVNVNNEDFRRNHHKNPHKYCYEWDVPDEIPVGKHGKLSGVAPVVGKIGSKNTTTSTSNYHAGGGAGAPGAGASSADSGKILQEYMEKKYYKAGRGSAPTDVPAGVDMRRYQFRDTGGVRVYLPTTTAGEEDYKNMKVVKDTPAAGLKEYTPVLSSMMGITAENANHYYRGGNKFYKAISMKSALSKDPRTRRELDDFAKAAKIIRGENVTSNNNAGGPRGGDRDGRDPATPEVNKTPKTYGHPSCNPVETTRPLDLRYEPPDLVPDDPERYQRQHEATLAHEKWRLRKFGGEELGSPISNNPDHIDKRHKWEVKHGKKNAHSHFEEVRFFQPEIAGYRDRKREKMGYTYGRGDHEPERDSGRRARTTKSERDADDPHLNERMLHHDHMSEVKRDSLFRQKENMRMNRQLVDGGYADETRQSDDESNDPYFWMDRKVRNPHGTTMRPEWLKDKEHRPLLTSTTAPEKHGLREDRRSNLVGRGLQNEIGVYNQVHADSVPEPRRPVGGGGEDDDHFEEDDDSAALAGTSTSVKKKSTSHQHQTHFSRNGPFTSAQKERISLHRGTNHEIVQDKSESSQVSSSSAILSSTESEQKYGPEQSATEGSSSSEQMDNERAAGDRQNNFQFYPGERQRGRVARASGGGHLARRQLPDAPSSRPRSYDDEGLHEKEKQHHLLRPREVAFHETASTISEQTPTSSSSNVSVRKKPFGSGAEEPERTTKSEHPNEQVPRTHDRRSRNNEQEQQDTISDTASVSSSKTSSSTRSFYQQAEDRIKQRDIRTSSSTISEFSEDSVFNRPTEGILRSKTEANTKKTRYTQVRKQQNLQSSNNFIDCLYPRCNDPASTSENGRTADSDRIVKRPLGSKEIGARRPAPKFTTTVPHNGRDATYQHAAAAALRANSENKQLYKILKAKTNTNKAAVYGVCGAPAFTGGSTSASQGGTSLSSSKATSYPIWTTK
ncbi:unnamed protein product [Amoebophrya sp. A120]|nr:unnamed protein product [Amoebophrya sp. A120]|eukprot:GSA120T00021822001.1